MNNKMRAILTMLGVIIGVGAVIIMLAISAGAEAEIADQIAALDELDEEEKQELADKADQVEAEATKGEKTNPGKLERLLNTMSAMAPDILEVPLGFFQALQGKVNEEVLGIFQPGDHGSTFGGNPLACAVARTARGSALPRRRTGPPTTRRSSRKCSACSKASRKSTATCPWPISSCSAAASATGSRSCLISPRTRSCIRRPATCSPSGSTTEPAADSG